MKILVLFKWSKNPQDARVGADGAVDWRGVKLSASDDDPAAMLVARDIAGDDGEIEALTLGDGDIAWAAARGASSSTLVTDAPADADSAALGEILAAGVRRVGDADVVLIGDSVWDYGVVAALAGQLGWPALAGVTAAVREGGRLKATRKVGAATQTIEVDAPVVLAVAASRAEKQAPGMREVLAARKKPVARITMADLGLAPAVLAVSLGTKLPEVSMARMIDGADPAAAASQLVAALRTDGAL